MRLLAAIALLVAAGVLIGGAHAAAHPHDLRGLYDAACPLAALGVVERQGAALVATTWAPIAVLATRVVASPVGVPAQAAAADVRLRAPPIH
jgi:hypothetical protein